MSFRYIKLAALHLIKWSGGNYLCKHLTRNGLRILCYHGFSLQDEHHYHNQLFMSGPTFSKRMDYLKHKKFTVLPLGEAVSRLYDSSLPENAVAITMDDGWYGELSIAAPILTQHRFPATLYIYTKPIIEEEPVFNVLIPYLAWKSQEQSIDRSGISHHTEGHYDLRSPDLKEQACDEIIEYSASIQDRQDRTAFIDELAERFLPGQSWRCPRLFEMMTMDELKTVDGTIIDLQLHTHNHRFPADDDEKAVQEIETNRASLENVKTSELVHFCFPSGFYRKSQFPILEKCNIRSATTTNPGFNYRDSHPLELSRFLDGENVSDVEFEAEMCGVLEMLRKLKGMMGFKVAYS